MITLYNVSYVFELVNPYISIVYFHRNTHSEKCLIQMNSCTTKSFDHSREGLGNMIGGKGFFFCSTKKRRENSPKLQSFYFSFFSNINLVVDQIMNIETEYSLFTSNQIEFISEDVLVSIIPSMSLPALHFISVCLGTQPTLYMID